jgi:hypothetical protein
MEISTRVIGEKTRHVGMVLMCMQMAPHMKDSGKKTYKMVKDLNNGLMAQNSKDITSEARNLGLGNIFGLMVPGILENGKITT